HHAQNYIGRPNTRILFVGYQAEETTGRRVLEGAKSVWIDDKQFAVKAHIRKIQSMSSHADQPKLLTWLKHIQGVKQVFVTHGDKEQRQIFAEVVKHDLNYQNVVQPENGDTHELQQSS